MTVARLKGASKGEIHQYTEIHEINKQINRYMFSYVSIIFIYIYISLQ